MLACETRPLLQGARLTAWELQRAGIPVTVMTEGAAAARLARGGRRRRHRRRRPGRRQRRHREQDRHLRARDRRPPPRHPVLRRRPALDARRRDRARAPTIDIEQRAGSEVRLAAGLPDDVAVWNPAFDVTPAALVTAIISDAGVLRPPFEATIADALGAATARVRAAVYQPGGAVRLEERAVPEPGPGEVLVAMRACGICGSGPDDVVRRAARAAGARARAGRRRGRRGRAVEAPLPARGRARLRAPPRAVRDCELCRRGHDTLCDTFKRTRIHPGGFSERILVPAENAARDLLADPRRRQRRRRRRWSSRSRAASAGCGARRRRPGTRLLVIGGGQMGLLTALAGLAAGATVAVAEPLEDRRGARHRARRRRRRARSRGGRPRRSAAARPRSCSPPAPRRAWDLALAAADKRRRGAALRPLRPGRAPRLRRRRRLLPRAGDPGQLLRRPARHPRGARPDRDAARSPPTASSPTASRSSAPRRRSPRPAAARA